MAANLDINSGLSGISYLTDTSELPDLGASRKTTVSTTNSYSFADNVGDALGYENQDKRLSEFARNAVLHQYNIGEHKEILLKTKDVIMTEINSDRPVEEKQLLEATLSVIQKDEMLFNEAQMARRVLIAV